jgi:GNAT superfamily N-acetyltransferase
MSTQELEFEVLTLEGLHNAVSGDCLDDGTVVPAWLWARRLTYFQVPPAHNRGKYLFLMATAALTPEEMDEHGVWYSNPEKLRKPVGVLGLQWSPYEEDVVWLQYITVDPLWQRRGIAQQLVRNMAVALKGKGYRLHRSGPSDEGLKHIKSFIDKTLDDTGIRWTQTEALYA